jgi:hypothetical protein
VITVYQWRDDRATDNADGSPGDPVPMFWQAVYPDDPRVNATSMVGGGSPDPDGAVCRGYLVDAYNRVLTPDSPVEPDRFEFVEPPEGWVDPTATDPDAGVVAVAYDPAADQTLGP